MDPKEEKMALAPQPRRAQRFRAVRAEGPPERTRSRDAERILSFVTVTGLAIIDVPYQYNTKVSKVMRLSTYLSILIIISEH
jgi:hypothetical protein